MTGRGEEEQVPLAGAEAVRAVELSNVQVNTNGHAGLANGTANGVSSHHTPPLELRGDKDIAAFTGYRSPRWQLVIFYALALLTAGLLLLLCRWYLRLRILLTLRRCWLGEADVVLVTLADGRQELVHVTRLPALLSVTISRSPSSPHVLHEDEIQEEDVPVLKGDGCDRLLEYRCGRYLFSHAEQTFFPVPGLPKDFPATVRALAAAPMAGSGSSHDRRIREVLYGSNELVIPTPTIPSLLIEEMIHPFFLFQYVSVLIWWVPGLPPSPCSPACQQQQGLGACQPLGPAAPHQAGRPGAAATAGDHACRGALQLCGGANPRLPPTLPACRCLGRYFSYSAVIVAMTLASILTNVFQAYRYRRRLARLAHYSCEVHVVQPGGHLATVDSRELLPGDVVVVVPGLLPCDLVLVRGEAIVDESMLTGESVPVRKVSWSTGEESSGAYDPDVNKGCTLFGGTTVAQASGGTAAGPGTGC